MPITLDGSNGITTPTYGGADTSEYLVPVTQFKNRIINGAMVIDQRNAGASVANATGGGIFSVDRFELFGSQTSKYTAQQNAGSVTPPAGFRNYLGITSSSAYTVGASESFSIRQRIEGFNTADLGFGTANASTVTLSFWVRSSLTGTFGGVIYNGAGDRFYPYSYTISSANTWEQKSITIAGDTTGTWVGATNGIGLVVQFSLGAGSSVSGSTGSWTASTILQPTGATSVVGTNGATFYITGVQLEVGSTATSFDYRPYGTELALCQRYYYRINTGAIDRTFGVGFATGSGIGSALVNFPVTMRTRPTAIEQTGTATDYSVWNAAGETVCNGVPTFSAFTTENAAYFTATVGSAITTGQGCLVINNATTAYLGWSAEL